MLVTKNLRVAFIGSGKVASELALIFQFKGIQISGISSRNEQTGRDLSQKLSCNFFSNPLDLNADLIIVATSDEAIPLLHAEFGTEQKLVYTAGAVDLASLSGTNWGVFYPLQTFTSGRHLGIDEIPILIETKHSEFEQLLVDLCQFIGFQSARCSSSDRQKYHVAAVFVNNFVNHLIHRAQVQLNEAKLDWKVLMPLIEETIAKLDLQTAFDAQTGPARRMDQSTLETHHQLLRPSDEKIYDLLTKSIQETYKK